MVGSVLGRKVGGKSKDAFEEQKWDFDGHFIPIPCPLVSHEGARSWGAEPWRYSVATYPGYDVLAGAVQRS
jgi:hypothetical protein